MLVDLEAVQLLHPELCNAITEDLMVTMFSGNARQTWTADIALVKLQSTVKAIAILTIHIFLKAHVGLNTPLMLLREVTIIHIMILDTEMEVTRAITTTPTRGALVTG